MQDAPHWLGLDPREAEVHFNPQAAFPDFKDAQAARAQVNARARETLACESDIAYGDHALRKLDIYPPSVATRGAAPVHVYIHGGYWRAQDKENFAFVAGALAARGVLTVVPNYELCPASTLDSVVGSAIEMAAWVRANIAAHGGDPTRIVFCGHSAGAHLAAAIMAVDWRARGVDPAFIAGAILVSGVYEPQIAMQTSVNADLHLDDAMAERHDMLRKPAHVPRNVAVVVGAREPWRWIDQSFRYALHLHRCGGAAETRVLPGWGHFDIIRHYIDGGPILDLALDYAGV